MSAPAISIIIVTHYSAESLKQTLNSLTAASGSLACETIVVDNNSADETRSLVHEYPKIISVLLQENHGFSHGCNRGAEIATGEYLVFLNPDVTLDPLSLEKMVTFHRSHSKAGVVVPRLRNHDESFQPSCRKFPTPFNILFSRGSFLGRHFSSLTYTLPDFRAATEIPAAAAAAMLIRRDTFNGIGRFDERFFLYMEDTDLCLRLHQSGHTNWYLPEAGAVHGWGRGSSSGQMTRIWNHHLSIWKYFLKHIPNGFTLILLPFLLMVNLTLRIASLPFRGDSQK